MPGVGEDNALTRHPAPDTRHPFSQFSGDFGGDAGVVFEEGEVGAQRRAAETGSIDLGATRESLLARDRIDSGRATAPLTMADGAVHVDTTPYSLEEVVSRLVELAEAVEGSV